MSDVNISEVINKLNDKNNQEKSNLLNDIFKDIVSIVDSKEDNIDDKLDACLMKISVFNNVIGKEEFLKGLIKPKLRESLEQRVGAF